MKTIPRTEVRGMVQAVHFSCLINKREQETFLLFEKTPVFHTIDQLSVVTGLYTTLPASQEMSFFDFLTHMPHAPGNLP